MCGRCCVGGGGIGLSEDYDRATAHPAKAFRDLPSFRASTAAYVPSVRVGTDGYSFGSSLFGGNLTGMSLLASKPSVLAMVSAAAGGRSPSSAHQLSKPFCRRRTLLAYGSCVEVGARRCGIGRSYL